MRLTCPNCSARYEVADTMVPPEGRDVQCSNCSTTWFQPGRRTDQQPAARVDRSARVAPPIPEVVPPPAPPEPQPEAQPDAAPPRRTLDPALRSILQEEAEREARLRRAEADPVETQAEMPLGQEPDDAARARRRRDLDSAPDAFAPAPEPELEAGRRDGQSARDLFPDIDEINSTLRDTGDRSGTEADASDIDTLDVAPRRRRGTRIGLFAVLLLAAAGVGVYVNAGRVAVAVPALAPALEGYVEAVNGARFWLDDLAQGLGGDSSGG